MRSARVWFGAGLLFVLACYLLLCGALGLQPLAHSDYDLYAMQAARWLEGKCDIEGDYPWLEIAQYQGRQFISFPPFPSLVLLPLVAALGEENVPSRLIVMCLVLLSYAIAWRLARRGGKSAPFAACLAVFCVLGCNLAEYGLYGGVWNMAQTMAFCLTLLAFDLLLSGGVWQGYAGLMAIACAVGCRPLQACYVPLLMYMAWRNVRGDGRRFLSMLIAPGLFAVALGAYNYVRFGNPFQFGHDYLPEFAEQSVSGQFSLDYVGKNVRNILRLPYWEEGRLSFPDTYGFAFWLCNPLFVLFACRSYTAKWRAEEAILWPSLATHFFILLMHKSFGGMQFGTRYLCDLVPAMYAFYAAYPRYKHRLSRLGEYAAMAWAVGFNLYGAWWFHVLVGS